MQLLSAERFSQAMAALERPCTAMAEVRIASVPCWKAHVKKSGTAHAGVNNEKGDVRRKG